MSGFFDYQRAVRIEADEIGDFEGGFSAEVADPVWFLGRQWAMGEHRGEDGGTPVGVTVQYQTDLLSNPTVDRRTDPTRVPVEAILEGAPDDWWTLSRRIRFGRVYATALLTHGHASKDLDLAIIPAKELTAPYDQLIETLHDGQSLWRQFESQLKTLNVPSPDPPANAPDREWQSHRLSYRGAFSMPHGRAIAVRHDGGEVDWFTFDVETGQPGAAVPPRVVARLPHRLSYPGAPNPRYWQIESSAVDLGGHPPDRTHLGTLLLIEMTSSHADDWFTVPIAIPTGSLVHVDAIWIRNSFDEVSTAIPPDGWTVFAYRGLEGAAFLALPTARTPLTSAILDRVVLAIDEDANKLFAIERVQAGRELDDAPLKLRSDSEPRSKVIAGSKHDYRYRPAIGIRRHWWPYVLEFLDGRRRWIQSTFDPELLGVDPQGQPNTMGIPMALINDHPGPDEPVHTLDVDVVPETGLVLETQYQLARATDGAPVLWKQRRRRPLLEGPTSGLRFDVVEPEPKEAGPK